jgi:hypothetical protein
MTNPIREPNAKAIMAIARDTGIPFATAGIESIMYEKSSISCIVITCP